MIVPDVNVLVHAHRREAGDHGAYREWLTGALVDAEDLGLAEPVLTGFVRVVTNPRVFADPTPTEDALAFVAGLRHAAPSRALEGGDAAWARLGELAGNDRQVRGNLVPDAWIASIALVHGARVATRDAGFARFGVAHFDPVA